jgi:hypothetical protein
MQLYETICNLCNYATICNYMQLMQLCNYMTDRCGNFNFMQLNATMLVLYCNLCNYIATICNYIATISYATICKYATICNYATYATYATILQLMQLYANLLQLMQLYCNNFICNYVQICNYIQLGVAISTLCNYMTDRCGNFNFMQLNVTICNYVGTNNVYWHDNLSSCFNECRYHQIGICHIYLPRVMIKI